MKEKRSKHNKHLPHRINNGIEQFNSAENIAVSSIPLDSVTSIRAAGGLETGIYRGPNGDFELLEEEGDEIVRVPIDIIGSSISPTAYYETSQPTIKKGFYFHYSKLYEFRTGKEEHVPAIYKMFKEPEKLDPKTLAGYLDDGVIGRDQDGTLYWSVGLEQPPIGPVESVRNVSGDGVKDALWSS